MTRSDLAETVGDPARQAEARARLRELLDAAPKTLTYMQWGKRLPEPAKRHRVALVSSFTLETMQPFLEVEAYLSGWRPDVRFVQYGQWQNALLDPAMLGGDSFEAAAVVVHREALLPVGSRDVDAAVQRMESLVRGFRAHHAAPLFVSLIDAPPAPDGIAFGRIGDESPSTASARLWGGLAGALAGVGDVHVTEPGVASMAVVDWFDPVGQLATISPLTPRGLIAVSRALARAMGCLFRPRRKVAAVDLDNTLWGGVVGEDGVEGVALGTEWPGSAFVAFQRTLRALRDSGILLAIVSKNNEADARAVFERRPEMLLGWDDFTARRIDWTDKAANLASLAEELGLGLDSIVFADDSPMECERVRSALPEVEVVELDGSPAGFSDKLLRTGAFDSLGVSQEDRARADSYRREAGRAALQATVADLDTFLADSALHLVIRPADTATQDRIHQLIGKTNQFNFTLERLSKETVAGLAREGGALYSAHLSDRFGDYGLIGVLHLEATEGALRIANMLISCRALGRTVELALLAFAADVARERGFDHLVTTCVRGPRNQQVFGTLSDTGFALADRDDILVDAHIHLGEGILPWPDHVQIESPLQRKAAE